eukprot:6924597-Prymnesium_polylepis.1
MCGSRRILLRSQVPGLTSSRSQFPICSHAHSLAKQPKKKPERERAPPIAPRRHPDQAATRTAASHRRATLSPPPLLFTIIINST